MDNAMYIGLSRQETLQRELAVTANNVANIDTAGFKVESLMVQTDPEYLPTDTKGPPVDASSPLVKFVLDAGVARDFGQGALKETGGPLTLAIQGQGFFRITTPAGERYTRDGRFELDAQGRIVTATGQPLQGDGGDIVLDPAKGEPKIATDGTVSQQGQTVAKVAVANFTSLSALAKDGDGLYRNVSNVQPQASDTAKVLQGMLESSNVEPMIQMTRLIEVSRAYETITHQVSNLADLASEAVSRLGKVA